MTTPGGYRCLFLHFVAIAGWFFSACNVKLPDPAPDLFSKFNTLKVGKGPARLISADLNLDGNADLVTANDQDNTVSIIYGNGNGTFQKTVNLDVPPEPSTVAVADLNHDGIPDLVFNSRGGNVLTILLGKRNGTFQPYAVYKTGPVPLAVILDDFNNDGHIDAAVTLTFSKLEIHFGTGDGHFKRGETHSTGSRSSSGVSADFNGDGIKDLAVAVASPNASAIRIFTGNGDGTFRQTAQIAEGQMPLTLIAKDMNNDGKVDLIAATGQRDNLIMLYGNGDGSFQQPIDFSGGGGPLDLTAGLFDDDSLPDVAVANSRSSNFSVIFRLPNGHFRYPSRDYTINGGNPMAITSGDFNNDGYADIAVAANALNTVEVYLRKRVLR